MRACTQHAAAQTQNYKQNKFPNHDIKQFSTYLSSQLPASAVRKCWTGQSSESGESDIAIK